MKRVTVAISILALSLASAQAGQRPARASRAADEEAIRKLVLRMEEGWNKGSGRIFAEGFAEDADYVVVNGMRVKGRAAIDAGHQGIFDTIYKDSRITSTIQSIRFLRGDVAVAHVEWRVARRENDLPRESNAMSSMVITRGGGRWAVAAFHNTPISFGKR
jgi:uncharacterized protein (TIGR02246 family)